MLHDGELVDDVPSEPHDRTCGSWWSARRMPRLRYRAVPASGHQGFGGGVQVDAVAVRGAGEWMGRRGNLGAALILTGVIISEIPMGGRRRSTKPEGVVMAEEEGQDISIDEELMEESYEE